MSRPKSEVTIQLERDRAIRKERRERKQAEREAKREARLKKNLVHERVERNGAPKVQPEESRFGLREALTYSPLTWCEGCGNVVREREMVGDICEQCYRASEKKEVEETEDRLEEQEGKAVPGKGDGGLKKMARTGQLILLI